MITLIVLLYNECKRSSRLDIDAVRTQRSNRELSLWESLWVFEPAVEHSIETKESTETQQCIVITGFLSLFYFIGVQKRDRNTDRAEIEDHHGYQNEEVQVTTKGTEDTSSRDTDVHFDPITPLRGYLEDELCWVAPSKSHGDILLVTFAVSIKIFAVFAKADTERFLALEVQGGFRAHQHDLACLSGSYHNNRILDLALIPRNRM